MGWLGVGGLVAQGIVWWPGVGVLSSLTIRPKQASHTASARIWDAHISDKRSNIQRREGSDAKLYFSQSLPYARTVNRKEADVLTNSKCSVESS